MSGTVTIRGYSWINYFGLFPDKAGQQSSWHKGPTRAGWLDWLLSRHSIFLRFYILVLRVNPEDTAAVSLMQPHSLISSSCLTVVFIALRLHLFVDLILFVGLFSFIAQFKIFIRKVCKIVTISEVAVYCGVPSNQNNF